jgi:hypothetical protein
MLGSVFDAFVKESPVSVMMRGLMEYVFRPQRLDAIFESHAKVQYTRDPGSYIQTDNQRNIHCSVVKLPNFAASDKPSG